MHKIEKIERDIELFRRELEAMKKLIICRKCKKLTEHQAFRLCSKCYHKDYKRRYPERVKFSQKKWYEKNKMELKKRRAIYESTPKRKNRKRELGKAHGIYGEFDGNKFIALIRDNFCCKMCKSEKKLNVHHINMDSSDHRLDNLITLCMLCHRALHRKYNPPKLSSLDTSADT